MLAAPAVLSGAVEEQVFGRSLKQKEYCIYLRVRLTRFSLGLWGLLVFQPHLEYLGAVLGAWRHEEGEESSLGSLLQMTLAASCQQEAQLGADTGSQCG